MNPKRVDLQDLHKRAKRQAVFAVHLYCCFIAVAAIMVACPTAATADYQRTSFNVEIDDGGVGGFIVYDVDGDGQVDFIITEPGRIIAYNQSGDKLWRIDDNIHIPDPSSTEKHGQPGHEGPGIVAGDIDKDNVTEVLYIDFDNQLVVIDGLTGKIERTISLPAVESHNHAWSIAIIANFRGHGDNDILLGAEIDIRPGSKYLRTKKIRRIRL